MTRRYIFDTGVMSLYFGGDAGIQRYLAEVERRAAEGLMVDLCLTELQYKMCQTVGAKAAEAAGRRIQGSRIRLVRCSPFLDLAWRLKCRYRGRFSLVDCVNLAVAQVNPSRILTTDSAFQDLREPRVSVRLFPIGD